MQPVFRNGGVAGVLALLLVTALHIALLCDGERLADIAMTLTLNNPQHWHLQGLGQAGKALRGRCERTRCACSGADGNTGIPASPAQLVAKRRSARWQALHKSLDWTRYHLQIALVEGGTAGHSRVAAGLFERIARFHGCAGALPVEAATVGLSAAPLDLEVAEALDLAAHWLDRDVERADASSLRFYDVVVCLDAAAAQALSGMLEASNEDPLPPNLVELHDFGAYLELRKPESPMKAWVPDWRQVVDPDFEERQAAASAPRDDALAVWRSLPEDLARRVQPHYEVVTSVLGSPMSANPEMMGNDDSIHAFLAFHVGGLVRFLMDTYPLDLQGGPGYDGPP